MACANKELAKNLLQKKNLLDPGCIQSGVINTILTRIQLFKHMYRIIRRNEQADAA